MKKRGRRLNATRKLVLSGGREMKLADAAAIAAAEARWESAWMDFTRRGTERKSERGGIVHPPFARSLVGSPGKQECRMPPPPRRTRHANHGGHGRPRPRTGMGKMTASMLSLASFILHNFFMARKEYLAIEESTVAQPCTSFLPSRLGCLCRRG